MFVNTGFDIIKARVRFCLFAAMIVDDLDQTELPTLTEHGGPGRGSFGYPKDYQRLYRLFVLICFDRVGST